MITHGEDRMIQGLTAKLDALTAENASLKERLDEAIRDAGEKRTWWKDMADEKAELSKKCNELEAELEKYKKIIF